MIISLGEFGRLLMKSINWQKGVFRLTLVMSILLGLLVLCGAWTYHGWISGVLWGIILFSLVWLFYFVIAFIVKGFMDKD